MFTLALLPGRAMDAVGLCVMRRVKGMKRWGAAAPLLAFCVGVAQCQGWPDLRPLWAICGGWALGLLAGWAASRRWAAWRGAQVRAWWRVALALWLGAVWAAGWGQLRLGERLADAADDQIFALPLTIASLVQGDASARQFLAQVNAPRPAGVPARLAVTWRALPGDARGVPELIPGEQWRMVMVLRQPYGNFNPQGPDREARWFAAGVGATATVRGTPRRLSPASGHWVDRARHAVRERLRKAVGEQRYTGVLLALVMGDQQAVRPEDWRVFNRSGITHLVSISGLHVTMLSGLAAGLVRLLWPRLRWRGRYLAERCPAQRLAGLTAMLTALAYCLLAGWSVPTRRTFFMLAVVAAASQLGLSPGAPLVLLAAAAAVLALDPWAVLAPGFWLSFGAVAILMRVVLAPRAQRGWPRLRSLLADFARTQAAVTIGLLPLLAWWVGAVSLLSPLANALAIPWISLLVTPLALAAGALAWLPGPVAAWLGGAAQALFAALMAVLAPLAAHPWASLPVAGAPVWVLAVALLGMAWWWQGQGWPARWVGLMCLLPLLTWRGERPEPGSWRLTALDVGQGGAVVIETARHVLLYDTGPRHYRAGDEGERIVVPFLRARGIAHLDHLVVSHSDLDHAGGLASVLAAVPVGQAWAPFDLRTWLAREARLREDATALAAPRQQSCEDGQGWEMDGVRFRFLHPPAGMTASLPRTAGNAQSCVLLIEGRWRRALLPGDVAVAQEALWADRLPAVDVVLAPHHGARGSSGAALVAASQARHVLVQAGRWSRFGHPAPQTVRRWQRAGAEVWRSGRDGAVVVQGGRVLQVDGWRSRARRYWHVRPDGAAGVR
ncbi:DNA internalization-related competence protein ComEC/Rec2 [Bordetella trematum]|uniref:DNA internalization-related competence protein ComEC/Rec2 n=1 Tax=Bordetella trematum TaxID=123899 RepID=UPI001EFFB479|nr:DNA internalization-related competence protein ComEC/Rec2 [Bordetella trematum]